ncbi:MAG: ABC transporter ATP-binding protein [Actinobacteria bacterium]|nr:ABC transporter ATP-binding protein [Actinomycetota bacterium]
MAVATLDRVTFTYAEGAAPALVDATLTLEPGELVAVLGPSGSGKSTLLRSLAGLVPHFHGGRFSGRATVVGRDTRAVRPAELAGDVATVFQDPEDQVVMTIVRNEVAFGLENVATAPDEIWGRAEEALKAVDAGHLAARRTTELSGGELQRVCLAAALALRPRLLLLDEPTSQLDPDGAEVFLRSASSLGSAVVLSEQRVVRALDFAHRVLYLEQGRIVLDAPNAAAREWLLEHRPAYAGAMCVANKGNDLSDAVVQIENAWFSYGDVSVLEGASLAVRRGEIVTLEGPNGSGKSTLAKLAAGLLEPQQGLVRRAGRAGYLSQDPGRYLACERVDDEVALGVGGDRDRAYAALDQFGLAWAAERHPRDLSSGERERLGVAAVVAGEPDLLVLDEPTRGVDPERKAELAAWIVRYAAAGHGVLIATHDPTFPAHRRISLGGRVTEERVAA